MDKIEMEILEDGTLSIKTSDISQINHISADALLDELEDIVGSKRQTEKRPHTFWKNRIVQRGGRVIKAH